MEQGLVACMCKRYGCVFLQKFGGRGVATETSPDQFIDFLAVMRKITCNSYPPAEQKLTKTGVSDLKIKATKSQKWIFSDMFLCALGKRKRGWPLSMLLWYGKVLVDCPLARLAYTTDEVVKATLFRNIRRHPCRWRWKEVHCHVFLRIAKEIAGNVHESSGPISKTSFRSRLLKVPVPFTIYRTLEYLLTFMRVQLLRRPYLHRLKCNVRTNSGNQHGWPYIGLDLDQRELTSDIRLLLHIYSICVSQWIISMRWMRHVNNAPVAKIRSILHSKVVCEQRVQFCHICELVNKHDGWMSVSLSTSDEVVQEVCVVGWRPLLRPSFLVPGWRTTEVDRATYGNEPEAKVKFCWLRSRSPSLANFITIDDPTDVH